MNIQATKFNLHKCTPKANEWSRLLHAPKKSRFTFCGMGWCLTQDKKISRTHHHGSDRRMITSQTKIKQDTDTHRIWVKATHKGKIF